MGVLERWSIVKLSGVIDIRSIDNSFLKIKQAADDGTPLEIDLADVADIDPTFLQLIESARRSVARRRGWKSGYPSRLEAIILETLRAGRIFQRARG